MLNGNQLNSLLSPSSSSFLTSNENSRGGLRATNNDNNHHQRTNSRNLQKEQSGDEDSNGSSNEAESIDSLDSQPLVGNNANHQSSGDSSLATDDDNNKEDQEQESINREDNSDGSNSSNSSNEDNNNNNNRANFEQTNGSHESGAKFRRKSIDLASSQDPSGISSSSSSSLSFSSNIRANKSDPQSLSSKEGLSNNNQSETTTTTTTTKSPSFYDFKKKRPLDSSAFQLFSETSDDINDSATSDFPSSPIDPMLSQFFSGDLPLPLPFSGSNTDHQMIISSRSTPPFMNIRNDLNPMSRLLAMAASAATAANSDNTNNGNNNNGIDNGKMVVRKHKNGATIIISSSSSGLFNDQSKNFLSANETTKFPSLIERLLPPFLRPTNLNQNKLSLNVSGSENNHNSTSSQSSADMLASNGTDSSATTTFSLNGPEGVNLIVASGSFMPTSPMSMFSRMTMHDSMNPINPFERLIGSAFNRPNIRFSQYPSRSLLIEQPPRSLFAPNRLPFPLPPSPLSLLNLLTKSTHSLDDENVGDNGFLFGSEKKSNTTNAGDIIQTNSALNQNNFTNVTQNSTVSQPKNRESNSDKLQIDEDSMESGLRPASRLMPPSFLFRHPMIGHPMPDSRSTIIVSSMGNIDDSISPFGPASFLSPPPTAQMMMMNGKDIPMINSSPFSPILKSILEDVMSTVASESNKNKSNPNDQRRSNSNLFDSRMDTDDDSTSDFSDRWDDPLTARHRQSEDDTDDDMATFMMQESGSSIVPLSLMMDSRGNLEPSRIFSGVVRRPLQMGPLPFNSRALHNQQPTFIPHSMSHRANNHRLEPEEQESVQASGFSEVGDNNETTAHRASPPEKVAGNRKQTEAAPLSDNQKLLKDRSDSVDESEFEVFDEEAAANNPMRSVHGKGLAWPLPKIRLATGQPRIFAEPNSVTSASKRTIDERIDQSEKEIPNPFTSPQSPLFGFPSSAASQSMAHGDSSASRPALKANARQPRHFTYHSNNEVAAPFSGNHDNGEPRSLLGRRKEEVMMTESSNLFPRFVNPRKLPEFQPTNIVMGRRMDDGITFQGSGFD